MKKLRVVIIQGKNYDPAVFIIYGKSVFTWNPSTGFFKHDKSLAELETHFCESRADGFSVIDIN